AYGNLRPAGGLPDTQRILGIPENESFRRSHPPLRGWPAWPRWKQLASQAVRRPRELAGHLTDFAAHFVCPYGSCGRGRRRCVALCFSTLPAIQFTSRFAANEPSPPKRLLRCRTCPTNGTPSL